MPAKDVCQFQWESGLPIIFATTTTNVKAGPASVTLALNAHRNSIVRYDISGIFPRIHWTQWCFDTPIQQACAISHCHCGEKFSGGGTTVRHFFSIRSHSHTFEALFGSHYGMTADLHGREEIRALNAFDCM